MKKKVIIIGAGPSGLASALEFLNQKQEYNYEVSIFEADNQVGGISKTLHYKGHRFDLGGHRFYTKLPEIEELYSSYLGKDMLKRKRLSRIFYEGQFYNYPLSLSNALGNLGIARSLKFALSYIKRQIRRHKKETNFDEWVSNRFGDELFKVFFKSYTEKVWGISTSKLSSDWAAQRIQDFNLRKVFLETILKRKSSSKTTVSSFYYPKFGPGMLYEKIKNDLEEKQISVKLHKEMIGINRTNFHIESVIIKDSRTGNLSVEKADFFISTIPLDQLVIQLNPGKRLLKEVEKLKFRNFLTVNLIVRSNPFPDQWLYIHDPTVKVGRIQNFKNWSPYMAKSGANYTPIAMEYFASENDSIWNMNDKQLINLASEEIHKIGIVKKEDIIDSFVYRVRNAYPIYNFDYKKPLEESKKFLNKFDNLFLCGRGALFRYNNQDHSIQTGFYATRNLLSRKALYNVWQINENPEYIEK